MPVAVVDYAPAIRNQSGSSMTDQFLNALTLARLQYSCDLNQLYIFPGTRVQPSEGDSGMSSGVSPVLLMTLIASIDD